MSFYSLQFFIYLFCVYTVFLLVPQRGRWIVLLGASFLFYSFLKVSYLPIALAFSILVTYFASNWIDRAPSLRTKKAAFLVGVSTNLALLILLRYLPFITTNLDLVIGWIPSFPKILIAPVLVSIGVSYFVFQALSYLIDVYSGVEQAERHLGYLALYLTFFPKLLQGPIERVGDLMPQLRGRFEFKYENLHLGFIRFCFGIFKKLVLADRIGIFVDAVYGDLHSYTGISLIIATYLYAFQIYFDFSGYTDMALGVARMFNIQLSENFRKPYQATSIADFWRRWHISFSRWLLDYLFTPLQMEFRNWKVFGTPVALFVTFLISGIWHGASWGFVAWGILHGLFLAISVFWKPYQMDLYKRLGLQNTLILKIWQIVFTFHLVCITWVFFRAATIAEALYIIKNAVSGFAGSVSKMMTMRESVFQIVFPGQSQGELLFILCLVAITAIISIVAQMKKPVASKDELFTWFLKLPVPVRCSLYAVLFYLIVFHGTSTQSFIYMQF